MPLHSLTAAPIDPTKEYEIISAPTPPPPLPVPIEATKEYELIEVGRSCRGLFSKEDLVLTRVNGQTRVSDGSTDEGSPQSAGSKTKLPTPVQARSHPAGSF